MAMRSLMMLQAEKIKEEVLAILREEEITDAHTLAHFTKSDFADLGIKAGPALKLIRLAKAAE